MATDLATRLKQKLALSKQKQNTERFQGGGRRTKTGKNANLKKEDRTFGGQTRQSLTGQGTRIKPALGRSGSSRGKTTTGRHRQGKRQLI